MRRFTNIRWSLIRKGFFVLALLGVLFASYRVGQEFAAWRNPHTSVPVNAATAAARKSALWRTNRWRPMVFRQSRLGYSLANPISGRSGPRIASIVSKPASTDPNQLPDASPELLRLITSAQLIPTEQAGAQIYRLDRPTLKAVVVLQD